jgi:hypothetical protein
VVTRAGLPVRADISMNPTPKRETGALRLVDFRHKRVTLSQHHGVRKRQEIARRERSILGRSGISHCDGMPVIVATAVSAEQGAVSSVGRAADS